MKNKNWHCNHCTGICICTRCLRQDIITQLKAYLISLGGNLNTLQDNSDSIFDALILKNFNQHLELTLGQNQWLYQMYPSYIQMINGQSPLMPNLFTDSVKLDNSSYKQGKNAQSGKQGQSQAMILDGNMSRNSLVSSSAVLD